MIAAPARPKAFAVWFKDLDRWDVSYFRRVRWAWPKEVMRPIGQALTRQTREVDPKADKTAVPIIEKISFGGQVSLSDPQGRAKYKGRLFWAEAGELIYSKIRVKQGSLAVVPPSIPRLAVSAEYPVYTINPAIANGRYLVLAVKSRAFQDYLEGLAHGGSTKTRIHPTDFESLVLPLPPLPVQAAIVRRWEKAQEEIAKARATADALKKDLGREFLKRLGLRSSTTTVAPKAFAVWFKDLERWAVSTNQQAFSRLDVAGGKYPVVCLSDVIADLENGWSPKCLDRPAEKGEWGVLKMGAVSFGVFNEQENKALPKMLAPNPNLEVRPGNLLISRANITRLVGACALVSTTRNRLMLCDKIFRAVWHEPSPIDKSFLDEILKIRHLRQQIENAVTGTSATMKNITKPALLALRLPLPPLPVQRGIVDMLAKRRAEIAAARQVAAKKSAEIAQEVEDMILGKRKV